MLLCRIVLNYLPLLSYLILFVFYQITNIHFYLYVKGGKSWFILQMFVCKSVPQFWIPPVLTCPCFLCGWLCKCTRRMRNPDSHSAKWQCKPKRRKYILVNQMRNRISLLKIKEIHHTNIFFLWAKNYNLWDVSCTFLQWGNRTYWGPWKWSLEEDIYI